MKKIILSIVIALSSITAVYAQFYIGGSLDLKVGSQSIKQLDEPANTSYSFGLSPEIGYSINKKMDIGLSFGLETSSSKSTGMGLDSNGNWVSYTNASNTKSFQISPYFRYSLVKWKRFNLLGSINAQLSSAKTRSENSSFWESSSESKQTSWGVTIHPVLIYNLSDKWALFSDLNFFRLGFSRIKMDSDRPLMTTMYSNFDLGFSSYDLLPAIGLIYKF